MSDLKGMIRRRKAADRVFAVVGLLSVVVALATLSALLLNLWSDAKPRLFVPKGSVAVTTGKATYPDGQPILSPADQAWEIRKFSGEALVEMQRDQQLSRLIDVNQLIDVARLKTLAKDGSLYDVIESGKLGEVSHTGHVKKLLAEGRGGEILALERFLPADRAGELKEKGAAKKLLNLDKVKQLAEGEGFAAVLRKRRLRENAKVAERDGKPEPSVLQNWVERGDFEANFPRLIAEEELTAMVNADAIDPFVREEVALAKARPKEFNSAFFTTLGPSAYPETTGILVAWVGSFLVIFVTMLVALPLGVAAGVYMEEYGRKNWVTALIEINIANLAGVPSIIYGLMALGFFIYQLHMNRSVGTAGLTLALLVLPIVIMATREAIRAIPQNIREASYACGATKWQTVRYHVLPYASGGILTGSIIGLSRAIGETAPLITIGAATFVTTLPASPVTGDFPFLSFEWLRAGFTAMPLQMFNLTQRPQHEFHYSAALAGIMLIVMTLSLNGVAIYLRYRLRKSVKW